MFGITLIGLSRSLWEIRTERWKEVEQFKPYELRKVWFVGLDLTNKKNGILISRNVETFSKNRYW